MKSFTILSAGLLVLAFASAATAVEDEAANTREAKSVKVARSPRIEERRFKFHNSMNKNAVSAPNPDNVELKAQQVRRKLLYSINQK